MRQFTDFSYSFSNKLLKQLIGSATNDDNISISASRLQTVLVMLANWADSLIKQKILAVVSEKPLDINSANSLCRKNLFDIRPWSEDDKPINSQIELNTFFCLNNGLQINSGSIEHVSSLHVHKGGFIAPLVKRQEKILTSRILGTSSSLFILGIEISRVPSSYTDFCKQMREREMDFVQAIICMNT